MNLKPLGSTIILKPDEYEREVETTLVIPDKNSLEKRSPFAEVIAVGEETSLVKPGQRILINQWFDQKDTSYFKCDGIRYRFALEHYVEATMSNGKIKPMSKKVLVKVLDSDDQTEGGIFLPDQSKHEKNEGIVMEVSGDVNSVKKDDRVIFGAFSGSEVTLRGIKHKIIHERELIAVFEEDGGIHD